MKILVVYDSVFGNTEKIAHEIGKSIGSQKEVETLQVNHVKPQQCMESDLLIVGSPTRAFRPTPAISKLLRKIPRKGLKGTKTAAFDTGIALHDINAAIGRFFIKSFGYAAKPISEVLQKKGATLIIPPEGFFVEGTEGPLKKSELELSLIHI